MAKEFCHCPGCSSKSHRAPCGNDSETAVTLVFDIYEGGKRRRRVLMCGDCARNALLTWQNGGRKKTINPKVTWVRVSALDELE